MSAYQSITPPKVQTTVAADKTSSTVPFTRQLPNQWMQSVFTLFGRPPALLTETQLAHPEQLKKSSGPSTGRAPLTLTADDQLILNRHLDELLQALRGHALLLFRIRSLSKTEIWGLNKQHTAFLELVKHMMPLACIPTSQIQTFLQQYQALTHHYEKLGQQNPPTKPILQLIEDWQSHIVAPVAQLQQFFNRLSAAKTREPAHAHDNLAPQPSPVA